MVFLQLVMGSYYRDLATGNRLRREVLPAKRGRILDDTGLILAEIKVDADGNWFRFYPDGEIVAAVTGYVGEGGGITGLEKEYEDQLKGVAGEKLMELNAVGEIIKELGVKESLPGLDLKTNLNLGLQRFVYAELKSKLKEGGVSGVVVVAKVSGEVLSLTSLPSFDPNLFIPKGERGLAGGDYASVEKVLADEVKKPLFNRAVSGTFAPGSVFKLVPAIAALSEGLIKADSLIEDTGEIRIDQYRYGNWYFDQYGRTEGEINIKKAIARSNDIFFYRLGEKLGIDNLVFWSKKLGVGETTGIDLPGEARGLLPDPLWRERTLGEKWFLGNTYHMSIGQGDLLMTPIQINRITATVVSGQKCDLSVVRKEQNCREIGTKAINRETIIEGMREACMTGGTAYPFFDLNGRVLCKTGTAQQGGEKQLPHAWMSVVIPDKDGQIKSDSLVITILLPEAGEGSAEAAPLVRKITDYILENYYGEKQDK